MTKVVRGRVFRGQQLPAGIVGAACVLFDLAMVVTFVRDAGTVRPGISWVLIPAGALVVHLLVAFVWTKCLVRGPGWTEDRSLGRVLARIPDEEVSALDLVGRHFVVRAGDGRTCAVSTKWGLAPEALMAAYADLAARRPDVVRAPRLRQAVPPRAG